MIASRPTQLNAMDCAVIWTAVAMAATLPTISGYRIGHWQASIPPMEPPTTHKSFLIPRWSISRFCARTMSAIVITGKFIR